MDEVRLCSQCGAMYVPTDPSDAAMHDERHKRLVYGIPLSHVPTIPYLIGESGDSFRVSMMEFNSPHEWKEYTEEVASWVAKSLGRSSGFTWYPYRVAADRHKNETIIFMLHRELRTIGLLATVVRPWFRELHWNQSIGRDTTIAPIRTVEMIWVAYAFRQESLGLALVRSALEHLKLTLAEIAWAAPFSADGNHLLQRLYPEVIKVHG